VEDVAQATSHSQTREKIKQSINKLTLKVLSNFRLEIQQRLEVKRPINFSQLSAVGRLIGDSIEPHSHCPDNDVLKLAIALVME
jgi:hypothetical protein